jgi:hypothetical protein
VSSSAVVVVSEDSTLVDLEHPDLSAHLHVPQVLVHDPVEFAVIDRSHDVIMVCVTSMMGGSS